MNRIRSVVFLHEFGNCCFCFCVCKGLFFFNTFQLSNRSIGSSLHILFLIIDRFFFLHCLLFFNLIGLFSIFGGFSGINFFFLYFRFFTSLFRLFNFFCYFLFCCLALFWLGFFLLFYRFFSIFFSLLSLLRRFFDFFSFFYLFSLLDNFILFLFWLFCEFDTRSHVFVVDVNAFSSRALSGLFFRWHCFRITVQEVGWTLSVTNN